VQISIENETNKRKEAHPAMAEQALNRLGRASGVLAVGAFTVSQCLYNVDGGERAVMFDSLRGGIRSDVRGEGTHFLVPVIQRPIIIDVRTKPREIPSVTGTKDLQMVNIKMRVLWRPVIEELPTLYRELGTDFDERVLPSIGNEVLKAVVAQYNAEELLSKRAEVSERIKLEMTKRAKTFHLTLDDVAITHLTFGREFMKAIEAKQVASQEAERQQWVVQRAEQERQAVVTRAEGEAEAATIITKAMERTGNAIIEVRRIDAAKEIASKLAHSPNVVYLPGMSSGGSGGGGGSGGLLLGIDTK
jgi:prohibitin 1